MKEVMALLGELINSNLFIIIWIIVILIYFCKSFKDIWKIKNLNGELDNFSKSIVIMKKDIREMKDTVAPENFEAQKKMYFDVVASEAISGEKYGKYKYITETIQNYFEELDAHNFTGVDPEKYFNEEDLVLGNFNVSKNSLKSSVYVGLGLLGTFIGITTGLGKLGAMKTVAGQISMIDQILPSMSFAFVTSIVGMACSLIYTRCEKTWMGASVLEISKLNVQLGYLFPVKQDIADILRNVDMSLQNLNSGLSKNLGSAVADSIGKSTKSLFGNFNKEVNNLGTDISNRIGGVFNEIFNQEFIDDFKSIHESLGKMNRTMLNTTKGVEKLLEGIPKYTEEFEVLNNTTLEIYQVAEKIGNTYAQFIEKIETLEGTLNKLETFKEDIKEMINISNESTQSMLASSNDVVSQNYARLEEMSDKLHAKYIEIGNDMKGILEESKNDSTALLSKTTGILEVNLSKVEETNANLGKTMEDIYNYNKNTNSAFLSQLTQLKEIIAQNEAVIKAEYLKMETNQRQLKEDTEQALQNYDKTISRLNTGIMEIISDVKDMKRE